MKIQGTYAIMDKVTQNMFDRQNGSSFMNKWLCALIFILFCFTGCNNGTNDISETISGSHSTATSESDSAVVGNLAVYDFSIPEDFTEMELEGFACYYSAEDGSCINLNIQPKDPSFDEVSAELLRDSLVSVLSQTYNTEVSITDQYFTRQPVCGYPAYQYAFSYELQDRTYRQLVVGIDADNCYTFTYIDQSGDWMDLFIESAGTIVLNIK